MNRKLTTILAGLSTAAAFAVNGSDWLHGGSASAGKFCVSAVFIVLVSLLLLTPIYSPLSVIKPSVSLTTELFLPTWIPSSLILT